MSDIGIRADEAGAATEIAVVAGSSPLPSWPSLWRVVEGAVEIYLELPGARRLVAEMGAGDLIFTSATSPDARLTATAVARARLREVAPSSVPRQALVDAADRWLDQCLKPLWPAGRRVDEVVALAPGERRSVSAGECVRVSGAPCWLHLAEGVRVTPVGLGCIVEGPALVPLSRRLPLELLDAAELQPLRTADLGDSAKVIDAVSALNDLLARGVARRVERLEQEKLEQLSREQELTHERVEGSMWRLQRVVAEPHAAMTAAAAQSPLAAALLALCERLGVPIKPTALRGDHEGLPALPSLARRAGVRTRTVLLGERWWRGDRGPMIVARTRDSVVIAVAPRPGGGYDTFDPARGAWLPLSEADAQGIQNTAYAVYRPFATVSAGRWWLVRFLLEGARPDLAAMAIVGLAAALFAAATPLISAYLIDEVIPGADRLLLVQLGTAIGIVGLVTLALSVVRETALLRIDGRSRATLALAVWDRILKLPAVFFRGFSAGDLAKRVAGIEIIRSIIVKTVLDAVLVLMLSAVQLVVLFFLSVQLALIAVLLIVVYSVVTVVVGQLRLRYERQLAELNGELAATVFQYLQGITKIRAAGAEDRAFARWADRYVLERQAQLRAGRIDAHFQAYAAAWPAISLVVLFAGAAWLGKGIDLSAGSFVAFLAAFGVVQAAFLLFSESILELMAARPLWQRAAPVFGTGIELADQKRDPGVLTGQIEVTGLSFAYPGAETLVLQDINLQIQPGQCVAFVGPSGSGKSTLFRLLLGFERPSSGMILYDGQDLQHLDLAQVRRQLGAVLQHGRVFAGSLFDNIRGGADLDTEECLAAAHAAGLEEELRSWPLGLHTPLTEGGTTLSGGQLQRLLIARALAQQPNILFLDEATSALDNRTQARVTTTFDRLGVTRLLIAHRLSTVRNADLICFLEGGRIVESDTYDVLMSRNSAFARFAQRQID